MTWTLEVLGTDVVKVFSDDSIQLVTECSTPEEAQEICDRMARNHADGYPLGEL